MQLSTLTILALIFNSFINLHAQDSPRFTKGYYSIGDHWKKLKPATIIRFDSVANMEFSKGYYSIDTSNKKLPKKNVRYSGPAKRPVFSKGYYSIGAPSKKDN